MSQANLNAGRNAIVKALREELLGPAPAGKHLEKLTFATKEESYGPWTDAATGEEILERDPLIRYGVGVLYPDSSTTEETVVDTTPVPGLTAENAEGPRTDAWSGAAGQPGSGSDDADFELSGANERRPTAMGISFILKANSQPGLTVEVKGGRYEPFQVSLPGGARRTWWTRLPVKAVWHLDSAQMQGAPGLHRDLTPTSTATTNLQGLDLRLTVRLRPHPRGLLVTVALVNQSVPGTRALDKACLFQTELTATPQNSGMVPYPEATGFGAHPDDASFQLIYRHERTFAVGHGCSADWDRLSHDGQARWAKADPLPSYETPSITPDIILDDGDPLTVSMASLAGTEPGGMAQLERVLAEYAAWIDKRKVQAAALESEHRPTADLHLKRCIDALERMREGLELVRDPRTHVGRAFRLANAAMLKQQLRSGADLRPTQFVDGRLKVVGSPPDEQAAVQNGRGSWRAFQIAFLLAAIPSTAKPDHRDRLAVDLIFFPTGGGKTEAYLGLSAFAMLLRRLRKPDDESVTVLMRYTLRLLTAQQFLRAAGLICALEELRDRESGLGGRFTIGIWVGRDSTPNNHKDAITALRALESDPGKENPFLLLRCPWCAAQMGPVKAVDNPVSPAAGRRQPTRGKTRKKLSTLAGYDEVGGRVVFRCPDQDCHFSADDRTLPVYVVDDDVYKHRPSLVIGTVDKFAQLAWNSDARSIFGIAPDGQRAYSPPELVIQDELHLIAGPLGSMTGLYEGVIEELCTDRRCENPVPPKIIASTATIRRHEEQIRSLYARDTVHLFPPHGIDANDSFFAVYARDPKTKRRLPGRLYIGVHAPALGSMQTTQVRSFSALLQAAQDAPEGACQDPWWTLMAFFNSLRELGNSLSLLQADIPDYLKTINNRTDADRTAVRYLNRVEEMTSRLRQDQIPEAMEKLALRAQTGKAIDVCLASSLIEVGIDIDRLSLMTVVGQPKSTSQYIQVTGRVGRKWQERPGLVVTLYGAAKPRDRSHFERFRSYHQRLYAQVEPTSATPFAPPALERALHAVVVAYIRQTTDQNHPYPFPAALFDKAEQLLRARVAFCDPSEKDRVITVLARLRKEWEHWQPTKWGSSWQTASPGDLMRAAGQYASEEVQQVTWPTPTSMRGADAECEARVTQQYAIEGARQ
ncbi:helicase-related protein [Streptomyces chartreusis]|uniref:helicase-related protein n=1 Tax=Streptomyces chartreusis TaxID=1969 RepID=UPI003D9410A4